MIASATETTSLPTDAGSLIGRRDSWSDTAPWPPEHGAPIAARRSPAYQDQQEREHEPEVRVECPFGRCVGVRQLGPWGDECERVTEATRRARLTRYTAVQILRLFGQVHGLDEGRPVAIELPGLDPIGGRPVVTDVRSADQVARPSMKSGRTVADVAEQYRSGPRRRASRPAECSDFFAYTSSTSNATEVPNEYTDLTGNRGSRILATLALAKEVKMYLGYLPGFRRLRWLPVIMAAFVAGATVAAVDPSAVRAAVVGDCGPGTSKTMHSVVVRDNGPYDATIGDATTRQLRPCTSPGVEFSFPAVLPANVEGTGLGDIVQVGFIRCGKDGGCGENNSVPSDGKVHFVYTPKDDCGGCFKLADGWSNGAPTVGHRYRYKITSEGGRWNFCIRDLTTGNVYFCEPGGIAQTFNQGTLLWWGTEVQNTNAAMGPEFGANNDINMYWMQYSNPANPNWIIVTDADISRTGQPHPDRYHSFMYNQNFNDDAFNSHTHE